MTTISAACRLGWLFLLLAALGLSVGAWAQPTFPGDVALTRALQAQHLPLLDQTFAALNWVGRPWPVTAVVTLALLGASLARRWRLVALIGLAVVVREHVDLLKWLVGRPRPSAALVRVTEHAAGNSFPSGHVATAVLGYGLLLVLVERRFRPYPCRRITQAGCLVIIGLMGPARVDVGAHWPSDTVGGYLWGLLALRLVLTIAQGRGWLDARSDAGTGAALPPQSVR